MAEEVVKTVENVDRLFSEIMINGEVHHSENYVPPVTIGQTPAPAPAPASSSTEEEPSTPSAQAVQGQDVYGVELNNILHDFSDQDLTEAVQTLNQALQDEVQARQTADGNLQSAINGVSGDVTALQDNVSTIQSKIPSQATSSNKLADKNFVNSSIATNTANFLGTYTSLADIEAIPNPTNNDYAFLQTTDSAGNNVFDRYKYNGEDDEWLFEYELNNSSFTAEQWATINSGITQVSDTVQSGDSNPVSSDAVYQALQGGGGGEQAIFDLVHPIDEVYVQYPTCKNPNLLYNNASITSVWTDITADYNGAFFRTYKNGTSGDFYDSNDSLGTAQASQNLAHDHGASTGSANANISVDTRSLSGSVDKAFASSATAGGICSKYASSEKYSMSGSSGSQGGLSINASHSHSITQSGHSHSITSNGGTEARPNNYAIKIWKRTA